MRKLNVNFPKNIARFESAMKRRFLVKTTFYKRLFRGKGVEFDSFRKYTEDDDASLIDWKASKRTNELLIKQYTEERDLKIFFIIDIGDNMVFGSGSQLKNEIAAEIAACLSHLIIISGDSIGFALYSGDIVNMKMFDMGIRQFYALEKNLLNPGIYGGKSNLEKTLRFLLPYLKKASAVFIISDFIKLDEEGLKILEEFTSRYETIGIMVRDSVDIKLPDLKREVIVEDIYTGQQLLINPSLIQHRYEEHALEQKKKVEDIFEKTGSDLLSIYTDKDFISPLVDFLKTRVKSRKFLVPRR